MINEYIGHDVAMFLQGCGGDAKVGDREKAQWGNSYEDVAVAGRKIADAVIHELQKGLTSSKAELKSYSFDMELPREPDKTVKELEAITKISKRKQRRFNAFDMLERRKKAFKYPDYIPITIQGIKLAKDMRMIALESEAVAELGLMILDFYKGCGGVTFPLSYSNGTQMYLPVDRMLDEGGTEVRSFDEYRQPASLAKGIDAVMINSLRKMKAEGID